MDLTQSQPNVNIRAEITQNQHIDKENTFSNLKGLPSQKPIVKCDSSWVSTNEEEAIKLEYNDYVSRISRSKNEDDKLALLFQAPNTNEAENIFSLNLSNSNNLTYNKKLLHCLQNFDKRYCNEKLFDQAENADKDNAYLWYLIATIHFAQQDNTKAREALALATRKAHFNNYYYETIGFIEQNIQLHSAIAFSSRLIAGLGVASAQSGIGFSFIIDYCKENQADIDVADLCLQTGLQLEKRSKTLFPSLMGLAIQDIHYRHYFKTDALSETTQKRKNYQNNYTMNRDYDATVALMLYDERLGQTWLNVGLAKGEAKSISQTINEAIIFSQDESYTPCPKRH